jgi:N-acetylmuramic acid 6-phosphate etherase
MVNIDDIATEQRNAATQNIDELDTPGIIRLINAEDKKVACAIENQLDTITAVIDKMTLTLKNNGRIVYMGAGTSGRLGVLDAAECPPTYNMPPDKIVALIAGGRKALTTAVENVEDNEEAAVADLKAINFSATDMLIGLAASGRTPYVAAGLHYARLKNAATASVACSRNSLIGRIADIAVEVEVGAEVVTGSTRMKAGTAQKLVLNMMSTAVMIKLGKVYSNLMVDVQIKNAKLKTRAVNIVKEVTGLNDDEALCLLEAAQMHVKTALVMHLGALSYEEACQKLEKSAGFIREALK